MMTYSLQVLQVLDMVSYIYMYIVCAHICIHVYMHAYIFLYTNVCVHVYCVMCLSVLVMHAWCDYLNGELPFFSRPSKSRKSSCLLDAGLRFS